VKYKIPSITRETWNTIRRKQKKNHIPDK